MAFDGPLWLTGSEQRLGWEAASVEEIPRTPCGLDPVRGVTPSAEIGRSLDWVGICRPRSLLIICLGIRILLRRNLTPPPSDLQACPKYSPSLPQILHGSLALPNPTSLEFLPLLESQLADTALGTAPRLC